MQQPKAKSLLNKKQTTQPINLKTTNPTKQANKTQTNVYREYHTQKKNNKPGIKMKGLVFQTLWLFPQNWYHKKKKSTGQKKQQSKHMKEKVELKT